MKLQISYGQMLVVAIIAIIGQAIGMATGYMVQIGMLGLFLGLAYGGWLAYSQLKQIPSNNSPEDSPNKPLSNTIHQSPPKKKVAVKESKS